ncbi:universal stress protein [Natrononativus amylolyticus]|uniref:universal stress protein n=1 Tax=Natrononativus amylolyticus TaxID=2963434 RepID=UPI0020CFC527|nr:universal stress protein [Natrononativus amylolyticus]
MDETILVAVDDSDSANDVLERAMAFAAATGGDLHVLTVVEPRRSRLAFGISEVDDLNTATASLADHVAEAYDGYSVDVHAEVRRGRPAAEILSHADEIGATLLVVGRHGTTGLPRALLGSTADRLTRLSRVPVVLVPGPDADDEGEPRR